jgi:hypothetical protein
MLLTLNVSCRVDLQEVGLLLMWVMNMSRVSLLMIILTFGCSDPD